MTEQPPANPQIGTISFQTAPADYRHWRVEYDDEVAHVYMDVDENGGLVEGYELKLNSYDLAVDIELADIVQRMRFEHPEVRVVVMKSGKDNVFCAGANIRMLAASSHAHKVNFCKFTNETRNTYEVAGEDSNQHYVAAVRGACAGGGYELALACNTIYLTDDGSSSVALPEVPLLAVLPGTGGLTRLTDKRKIRRDLADVFCSVEEGVRGSRAKQWGLVDEVFKNSSFDDEVQQHVSAMVAEVKSDTETANPPSGIALPPLQVTRHDNGNCDYEYLTIEIDRKQKSASLTIIGPQAAPPVSAAELEQQGASSWMLQLARELDDAILHLRFNELDTGIWLIKSAGDSNLVAAHEAFLLQLSNNNWLAREILHYWKRILKRVDVTSRSLIALIEHGSCFSGCLAELLFAADRSYMMMDEFEDDERPLASLLLTVANRERYPMANGLSRLETRFLGQAEQLEAALAATDNPIDAEQAMAMGLVTFAYDDIDWFDEIRVFLEERASFSPDAMSAMEANLRFAGPETMETRIFGRLSAWQNWVFQRPNAVGETGALKRYGSGSRADFDPRRV